MLRFAALGLFLLAVTAHAQDADAARWLDAVQKTSGKPVQIRFKDGHKETGSLVRGTASDLVVKTDRGETMIARSDVRELLRRKGRSRGGRAKLGAIIGAVSAGSLAGVVVGTAMNDGAYIQNSKGDLAAFFIGGAAFGAGVGAGIGAIIPTSYETVYLAP